jgi:hypothetical protein
MIGPELLLFTSRDKKDSNLLYDLLLLTLIIPFLTYSLDIVKEDLPKLCRYIYSKIRTEYNIIFEGLDRLDHGRFYSDYPIAMLSIFRWVIHNKKSNKIKYFNVSNNYKTWHDRSDEDKLTGINFTIEEGYNILLEDDIYLDITQSKIDDTIADKKTNVIKTNKTILKLKSKKHNIDEINLFINKCLKFNKEFESEINKDKLYHFIFKGTDPGWDFRDCFLTSILSDYNDPSNINNKTFDCLHFSNKDKLIKNLDRLKNLAYYKRNGLTRKAGFLLYGPPGCGKTGSVIASALHTKRHIIEVPMSRIKKNSDIEELFNLTKIGNVDFTKEDIIILFDEIDQIGIALQKRESEKNQEKEKEKEKEKEREREKNKGKEISEETNEENKLSTVLKEYMKIDTCKILQDDSVNLGILLSRLDGIGNYDGLIIMATTNCKDELSPALYRDGRLNPLMYDYACKEDIIKIIEQFYENKLSPEQIERLPDKNNKISHSTVIKNVQDNEDDIEGLIKILEGKKLTLE